MAYEAETLERQFRNLGGSRRGRKKYANDAGYWTGGHCNWGGSHTLKEDCKTLASSFTKVGNLKDIQEDLKKCTSKSEYDAKKANYIRKCEEGLRGLQEKTASSSMFGVCCIWSDEAMDKHVISKLNSFQTSLTKLKGDLEREDYKWVQELKQLKLEEAQITKRMEENKRKTANETDPAKKALLLQMIEEDGKRLKSNLKRQQELSNKFTFDPNKKVDDLIEAMKRAVERTGQKKTPGGSGRNRNPNNPNPESSDDDDNGGDDNDRVEPGSKKEEQSNFLQSNPQLILLAGIALLVLFYLYSNQSKSEPYYDF